MVAGRGSRSENQQQSAEHQPGRGGELRVVPALQHGGRPREARRLGAGVEPGGPVDEEGHGEAGETEGEDHPAEPVAPGPGRDQAERDRERADGCEQIGVSGAGGFDRDQGRGRARQARVAGLADL
ncbi:MAG TPA: hypothetical protein VGF09_00350, partial [Solirubrobacterales bacterium]